MTMTAIVGNKFVRINPEPLTPERIAALKLKFDAFFRKPLEVHKMRNLQCHDDVEKHAKPALNTPDSNLGS